MIHQLSKKNRLSCAYVAVICSVLSLTTSFNPYSIIAQGETGLNQTSSSPYHVYLGGDAIGIKIMTDGLVVMDTFLVETANGAVSPAKEAGVQKGDVIIAVNEQSVSSIQEYKDQIQQSESASTLQLTVNREGKQTELAITPVVSLEGVMTTGMYLRDSVAGIGTLTFVDSQTFQYGALGHEISDAKSSELVAVNDGIITKSNVLSVRRAQTGHPGEKVADIYEHEQVGTLTKNNYFGIFGTYSSQEITRPLIEVAPMKAVEVGPAQIYTVLEGSEIEVFDIMITHVNLQAQKDVKGIKYEVTDEVLLEQTGGIVQGMSGSPIVQNGKLIGAVTHVLVHDPKVGYGVFIEWMLEEANMGVEAEASLKSA